MVKRFDINRAESWKSVELAEREARVLRHIHHPLLPRYVDHFEEASALYTVMTHIEGVDLATQLRLGRRFGEEEVVALMRDAAESLVYLHEQLPPIIHRDLKPSNIIYAADGRFRIVDFGAVAERLRGEGGSTVVGTFGYMAPEQFQGRAGPASDIYSLGATVMALLTGTEPEKLPHIGLAIDVRGSLADSVSPALVAVLEKMLEPNPEQRPSRLEPLLLDLTAEGSHAPHGTLDIGSNARMLRSVLPVPVTQGWAALSAALPSLILLSWAASRGGSMLVLALCVGWVMLVSRRSTRQLGRRRAAPAWAIWLPHFSFVGVLAVVGAGGTLWGWRSSEPWALVLGCISMFTAVRLWVQWMRLRAPAGPRR